MKILLMILFTMFFLVSMACAHIATGEDIKVAREASSAGSPVYMAGQIEWIAKTFSPECRIKKTDVVMTGG